MRALAILDLASLWREHDPDIKVECFSFTCQDRCIVGCVLTKSDGSFTIMISEQLSRTARKPPIVIPKALHCT